MIDRLQASWSLLGLQRMATALFATLDPATGQLRIASAGHLPPLLITDGHAEFLPVTPSRMLGAPPAPAPALEWAGVLPVGATMVLFTDGLVESRSADIDEGLAHLLAAAAGGGRRRDPDELCDRLLADLTGAHRADDIALLALTRLGCARRRAPSRTAPVGATMAVDSGAGGGDGLFVSGRNPVADGHRRRDR